MKQIVLEIPDGYKLEQEGNVYTVVEDPFKLEVGKDYAQDNRVIVIDRRSNLSENLGFFNDGGFDKHIACNNPSNWREATEEEVIEAFEKECVRRLGENWREVKIKECMFHG